MEFRPNDVWTRLLQCREKVEEYYARSPDDSHKRLLDELAEVCSEGKRRAEERETLLREVTLVLSCTSVQRVLQLILDSVIRLSNAERAFVLLSRADGGHEIVAARNVGRVSVESAADKISRQVINKVIGNGRSVRLADALHTPPFSLAESVTRLKLLSVLCVPILGDKRVLGALYLENRKASGVFTAEIELLINDFADRIGTAILNAEAFENLRRRRNELQAALAKEYEFEGVVGNSATFREVLGIVRIAAKSNIPIIIEGESGTGKELLAHAVHHGSPRCDEPFISVNCAALPHALLESELFGHTRGAYTGAVRDRRGLFASAHGGTLFLDEIGEMPLELQSKLLRVLQSGEYRSVGSDRTLRVDVRIVAATQRNLAKEVAAKRFREDLFFRLNGVLVCVPPLRGRREDIPLLIGRFLEKYAVSEEPVSLEENVRACLIAYDYPGNVRELETIIQRAMLFAHDGVISLDALPAQVAETCGPVMRLPIRMPTSGKELLDAKEKAKCDAVAEVERAFLIHAMAAAGGRPGEAARRTKMNRSQFARMLSKHGLSSKTRKQQGGE